MAAPQRPLPIPTGDSRPYWEAARRHELMMQKCMDCKSPKIQAHQMTVDETVSLHSASAVSPSGIRSLVKF